MRLKRNYGTWIGVALVFVVIVAGLVFISQKPAALAGGSAIVQPTYVPTATAQASPTAAPIYKTYAPISFEADGNPVNCTQAVKVENGLGRLRTACKNYGNSSANFSLIFMLFDQPQANGFSELRFADTSVVEVKDAKIYLSPSDTTKTIDIEFRGTGEPEHLLITVPEDESKDMLAFLNSEIVPQLRENMPIFSMTQQQRGDLSKKLTTAGMRGPTAVLLEPGTVIKFGGVSTLPELKGEAVTLSSLTVNNAASSGSAVDAKFKFDFKDAELAFSTTGGNGGTFVKNVDSETTAYSMANVLFGDLDPSYFRTDRIQTYHQTKNYIFGRFADLEAKKIEIARLITGYGASSATAQTVGIGELSPTARFTLEIPDDMPGLKAAAAAGKIDLVNYVSAGVSVTNIQEKWVGTPTVSYSADKKSVILDVSFAKDTNYRGGLLDFDHAEMLVKLSSSEAVKEVATYSVAVDVTHVTQDEALSMTPKMVSIHFDLQKKVWTTADVTLTNYLPVAVRVDEWDYAEITGTTGVSGHVPYVNIPAAKSGKPSSKKLTIVSPGVNPTSTLEADNYYFLQNGERLDGTVRSFVGN
ncbi:Uncharacterised protein [Candidatus Norongarragalina meridionalis]|nr:Uncharacterised protein [Candidatus Norongarragalina meridionalis]